MAFAVVARVDRPSSLFPPLYFPFFFPRDPSLSICRLCASSLGFRMSPTKSTVRVCKQQQAKGRCRSIRGLQSEGLMSGHCRPPSKQETCRGQCSLDLESGELVSYPSLSVELCNTYLVTSCQSCEWSSLLLQAMVARRDSVLPFIIEHTTNAMRLLTVLT
ncbi:uncharacterized protein BO66DRAFT_39788 [Aspergillus aculeatinus CBS 121060]|uniref:Uncharacterized protein n=1 Tax=Aspergillus aculeatinus CBS 121060 TaxID=1448322 RepID=A0ACD1HF76_9EURO|nr:hypothetical protein BO66DRAFT_39788 [Aspergillus aculeatinus CBS 121060]RAH72208.1 hypothetical protein BO66DRAFT_39788 [Aspergillus aculeatinus CBS 121060]